MNKDLYKLVYSQVLNMMVPVSEAAPSHGVGGNKRLRKAYKSTAFKNLLSFTFLISYSFIGNGWADTVLPAGISVQTLVGTQIKSSDANSVNFQQLAPKAIVDWNTFNLTKGQQFNVDMQATWSMLNRIHDTNASTIDGLIKANGNLFFINTNGIIFGANSQFNVGSLYAGTLDITDKLFTDGFIQPGSGFKPAFNLVGAVGKQIEVQKGAVINTARGGKVLLFAENVVNNGLINTPDGQTILAAGKKVYLQDSSSPAGFFVEVEGGGTATNLGTILAERGNITMMGLAVKQSGTLQATTSVRANGSIYLQAPKDIQVSGANVTPGADRKGSVELTENSVTQILPELQDKEEINRLQAFKYDGEAQSGTFKKSEVKIEASLINDNGKIIAKGGEVSLISTADAPASVLEMKGSEVARRIYLGNKAVIDVSGVDAIAPMSRNQYEVQLYSGELKDAPILRDSKLYKDIVFIDARKGIAQDKDSLVLDITPLEKLSKLTVAEALTKGGTVNLNAPGADVLLSKSSKIDVSGGSTTYLAGNIKETNLVENGKLVPISKAKTGVLFQKTQDVIIDKDVKWGVTRAYDVSGGGTSGWNKTVASNTLAAYKTVAVGTRVESYFNGDDAGTFSAADSDTHSSNFVSAGEVLANTKISGQQLVNQTAPKGGTYSVGANDLVVSNLAKQLTADFSFGNKLAENYQSVISNNFLANGFNHIGLGGTINAPLLLKPNGSLEFRGGVVNADIIAPGAAVNFYGSTTINNAKIITAGNFTNDTAGVVSALTQVAAINGGNITALGKLNTAQQLTLGDNVVMDTSASARISNAGQSIKGIAGNIKYVETNRGNNVTQKAFGFDKGGELDITFENAKALNIAGNNNKSADDIDIDKKLFSENGFSKISFSSANNITIGDTAAAQEIVATQKTWQLASGIKNLSNSQTLGDVASPSLLPEFNRKPVSLSFSSGNTLTLAETTTVRTDASGSVSLGGFTGLNVLGSIFTPSGKISLSLKEIPENDPVIPQNLFIGNKAILSAAGTTLIAPDSQPNLLKNKVLNAGSIELSAATGSIIVKNGATLDVSAVAIENDTQTINGYQRESLYGDAGNIGFTGKLALDGTVKGAATGTGRAGTLSAEVDTITKQKVLQATNVQVGDALIGEVKSAVSEEQIKQGGFANLTLKSSKAPYDKATETIISIDKDVNLNLVGNVDISAATLKVNDNGRASITANNLRLKNANATGVEEISKSDGQLSLNAQQISVDTLSTFAIAGVKKTTLKANLNINGKGVVSTNGELELNARQIQPNTGVTLGFNALGDGSKVVVNSNGKIAKTPLSAQGTLNITAETIVQNGVLSAPFGEINLNATKLLTLTPTSVTSISANNQLIPFGSTSGGGSTYELQYDDKDARTSLHDKKITLKSEFVDLQAKAKVDVSAGGDVFASEWIDGAGGSKDIFLQPNTYAILPSLGAEFAPVDTKLIANSAPVGFSKTVYLSGVPGLADGNYTLLPARYALMPNAFLVQANPTVGAAQLPKQVTQQIDGTTLTAGYFGDLGTAKRDANWTTFKVTNGAVFRPAANAISKSPAEYKITSASRFFSDPRNTKDQAVPLPLDVGKLGFDAKQLNLDGTIVVNKSIDASGKQGLGLSVDINATNIRVVSNKGAPDGSLQLTASSVNALNAESVLLGGSRKLENGVVNITTGAETVVIENDAANSVKTPELIATATQKVTVKAGASVDTGAAKIKPNQININTNGNGATLALSSNNDITYTRSNVADASTNGELSIEAGATIKAGNSVVLDATKSAKNAGTVSVQDGGSATLGANNILIGNAPAAAQGLAITSGVIAALGQLKSLAINSYNNIDTFGAVNIGNKNLNLSMNAAGIVGHLAAGETAASVAANPTPSTITANTFTLKNTSDAKAPAITDNSGRAIIINADNVRFEGKETSNTNVDAGKTQITGFTQATINANEIRASKTGETNFNVAATKLNAGRITADSAANFSLKSSKQLETTQLATAPSVNPIAKSGIGAALNIAATDLTIGSKIDVDSGKLALASTNNLTLTGSANVSAKSASAAFYNRTEFAPAGSVTLTSSAANVNINTGAVVDVTSQNQADAGSVVINAVGGTANIVGNLKGAANAAGKGGALEVDVKTLANLTTTNTQASGFSEGRSYRVRTGDVNITGTGDNALKARDINVVADAGAINVTGDIIATAPKNSRIALQANNNLTLASTANLRANSTIAGEEGGKVELATKVGVLNLQTNSKIDVSGGVGGNGGKVHLRTPRANNTASAIASNVINSTINGARSTVLEAVKVFTGITKIATGTASSGGNLGFTTINNDVNSFMTNKDAILASLSKTGNANFHLRAGEEIQSTGDLEVSNDWNLYSATRAGNEPGVLTIRTKGNVNVKGTINDGFTTTTLNTPNTIAAGDSWAYNIVAGADFTSANKLATTTTGNLNIGTAAGASNVAIRTGIGDINLAAGGNLVMGNDKSVIYTAGVKAANLAGFVALGGSQNPLYLTNGGDVNINVKGDIVGKEASSQGALVKDWLKNTNGTTQDNSWWVRPDLFKQSSATLGGGDISVKAGGSINQFSAAAPTTAQYDTVSTDKTKFDANGDALNKAVNGGGDVIVQAGQDINNGVYFVAKGDGNIKAGGNVNKQKGSYGTTLLMQDGSFKVEAAKDLFIETVSNPTLLKPILSSQTGSFNYFNSYGENAGVATTSLNGNIKFSDGQLGVNAYFPSKLKATAFNGDLTVQQATLTPAAQGDLKLLAANQINLGNINVSDAALTSIPSPSRPFTNVQIDSVNVQFQGHDPQLLHKNDTEPVLIIANTGDIADDAKAATPKVTTPKVTKVVAGRDIGKGVQFNIQNNKPSDISLLKAGNDINVSNVIVSGPGELLLQAGRDIDLAKNTYSVIATTGNAGYLQKGQSINQAFKTANPALPVEGAAITFQAGLGKDAATANVQGYIDQYLLPTAAGPNTLKNDAVKLAIFKANTTKLITSTMQKITGNANLSDAQAFEKFNAASDELKTIVVNRHLSSELLASSQDYLDTKSDERGYAALAKLFPTKNPGDIILYNNKVTTLNNGPINFVAPNGKIVVGLNNVPVDDVGVLTEKGGNISMIADGDILVNNSKVITEFGGDLLLYSDHGNIDAGKGSKSAVSVPQRFVSTDKDGNTTVDIRAVAVGSGIRTETFDEDGPNNPKKAPRRGDAALIAPRGFVNAGEAGISSNNLTIRAPIVLNADNIQVQGSSVGVPIAAAVAPAGLGATSSPDSVKSAVAAVAESVAQSASKPLSKPVLPSIISVDIISIGK